MDAAEIVRALGGRMTESGGMVRCPAHDDTTPSLHVTAGDGRVLVHCHAGCTQEAVLDTLREQGLDLRRSRGNGAVSIEAYRHPTLGSPSRSWPYYDATGRLVGSAARFETPTRKTFRPLVRDAAGRWHTASRTGGFPKPYPLFNLPALLAKPMAPVLICEGEQAAEAASHQCPDWVAVTSLHGAKAPQKSDWSSVATRDVTIWPDADDAGARFAGAVAQLVHEAGAASVRIVPVPNDVPAGWDLADPLPEGMDLAALLASARKPETEEGEDRDEFARVVSRLAALPPDEYDRCRRKEAQDLGVRTRTLDLAVKQACRGAQGGAPQGRTLDWPAVEPWTTAVDGAGLLTEIAALISTYVAVPRPIADAIALWVALTWVHDRLEISTFLNLTSATKRCGKSLLLDVISELVFQPLPTTHLTPAVLFRIIDQSAPTLLLDEADQLFANKDITDLRAVINGSQRRTAAYVVRCVGDDHEPRAFGTWCPKALAGIGDLPDTVRDRALVIRLERRPFDVATSRWRDRDRVQIARLQQQIVRWTADHVTAMLAARNAVVFPAVLHDRARDAWEALLAMGHTAGDDWAGPDGRAQRASQSVAGDADDDLGAHEQLLVDLRAVFRAAGDPETLSTNHLLGALQALEERPWNEWRRGKPISARGLAHVLRPFKIQPETIRFTAGLAKGYRRDALQPAWTRYLPQDRGALPVTSVTSLNREDLSAVRSVTTDSAVTDRSGDKPSRINDVTDVTPDEELSITEAWEERAAILEFDAGYSREHAEALATEIVT